MTGILLIHGATKVDADGLVADAWLLVEDGLIVAVGQGDGWRVHPLTVIAEMVDADGGWLTPGFIDLHGHGAGGHSYEDDADGVLAALAVHRAHGTTRSVLSLVTNPLTLVRESLSVINGLADSDPGILGVHLEGPFLAMDKRGAHSPQYLRPPTPEVLDSLVEAGAGRLRQVTIAPELPGGLEAIARLTDDGIVAAIGHTDADYALTLEAFDAGASLLTHAFNAMNGIHHRAPGPLIAAFESETVSLELIADGHHVHPGVMRLAFDEAPGRIALITDSMAAAGSVDGDYGLGDLNVTVRDGVALLSGTSTIAGSTLTQDAALRTAVHAVGVTPAEAIAALTSTPARVLGLDEQLGYLRPGYLADLVLLDADLGVVRVWSSPLSAY